MGWLIQIPGDLHAERQVRSVLVVASDECVESQLLLEHVRGGGLVASFLSVRCSHIVNVANSRLYVQSLGDETPRAIAGAEHPLGIFQPTFSPDVDSLAFVAGSELKRIAAAGGAAIENPFGAKVLPMSSE